MTLLPIWLVFWVFICAQWIIELLNLPIIRSLLDVDFYKINMLQVILLGKTKRKNGNEVHLRTIKVKYQLINRSRNTRIADIIPEAVLRYHLDAARKLRFTKREVNYLRSLNRYVAEFFDWIYEGFVLPSYELAVVNGQYRLIVNASWPVAMFWETIFMSIIAELFARYERKRLGKSLLQVWREGDKRLTAKIHLLLAHPNLRIVDFGTRRRYSQMWQGYVLVRLKAELGKTLVGTSNVYWAWKLGLKTIGTMAHEMFMVFAAIHHETDAEVRRSQIYFIDLWQQFYGKVAGALTVLTDTFGVAGFFEAMRKYKSPQEIEAWNLRQDSGSTDTFCQKALDFWKSLGILAPEHTITYSDGLDVHEIIRLHLAAQGRYLDSYGWGTSLMNDVGLTTLKIVVKALQAEIEGVVSGLVKLSDEAGKYTAEFVEDLIEYLRIFNYPFDERELREKWQSVAV